MRAVPWLLAGLWLAGVVQAGVASHMSLFGIAPDFLLIYGLVVSSQLTRPGACGIGFLVGLISGGLVGANMTHYLFSRLIASFFASWSKRLRFELTFFSLAGIVFSGTLLARLLFMFTAAPPDVPLFLRDTIAEATYNGVLALPLYGLVKRVVPQSSRRRI